MSITNYCYIVTLFIVILVYYIKIQSKIHEHMLKISHLEHENRALWSVVNTLHSKIDPSIKNDASKNTSTREIKRDYLDDKIRMHLRS